MKEIIEQKLFQVNEEMKGFDCVHLYWLNTTWQKLRANQLMLESILKEAEKTGV